MSDFTPIPDVLALLVCDQIITDRISGKQSLIGMFSTIHSARYPVIHPQLAVYVALTDGRGKTPLTIRIVDADESRPPLVQGTGVVEFKNPRVIANLALQFHGLRFPEPGQYRVQLSCKETLLREARLMLVKAKRPPRPPGPPTSPQSPEELSS
ncbi:MAG TPA: hypothetical protein VM243_11575 [Phycisphaerae bacterium]|nr:hypothetical protein [Phycisphaerae bacterium]